MITTQANDPRVRPSAQCIGGMVEDLTVSLLHLLEGVSGIERCDGDIAAVDDAQPFFEWVHAPDGVVAAPLLLAGRAGADASGTETCTGSIGGAGVVREAEDGDVERLEEVC